MAKTNHTSLSVQVSKKMSLWILVLTIAIIVSIFFISLVLSDQLFKRQVDSWIKVAPQHAITNLIDSDYFSINREIDLIKSTGLFSSFGVADSQKKVIASFGVSNFSDLIPIHDEANVIWGYYFFKTDFYTFFSPFLIAGWLFLSLILIMFVIIRWRIKSNLKTEFSHFHRFLNEIDSLTERIPDVYQEDSNLLNSQVSYSAEQVIINKAILRLLEEIKKANKSLREAISASEQKKFENELTRTALQVVHDIGSPLAALEAIMQSASFMLPEESRVAIHHASTKIRDIVNSLLKKARRDLLSIDESTPCQQLLQSLIHQVVTEKRLQYQANDGINIDFNIDTNVYGLFAYVKAVEFSRMISNLITNAVESLISGSGNISIHLKEAFSYAVIQIRDHGKGIARELISNLGKMGSSYGKNDGHGLGLFHAKSTVENWGGRLDITSEVGKGTTVSVYLPKSKSPVWFLPELSIANEQTIVIIDDDQAIHHIWEIRFNNLENKSSQSIHLVHLYSPEALIKWKNENELICHNSLYLCDYEFIGSNVNGVELINHLRINFLSVLVTSRFNMDDVITECESGGFKLLPKDMASIVPISIS